MVRDRGTGRFVYTERLERRAGETSWEYVRRETRVRTRFDGMEVIVGWNVGSVEDFLRSHPEYRMDGAPQTDERDGTQRGDGVDR